LIPFNLLLEKLADAYNNKLPFVAYNKPNSYIVNGIFQEDATLNFAHDYSEEGFVFAPFDSKEKAILIPNHISISAKVDITKKNNLVPNNVSEEPAEAKENHIGFVRATINYIENSKVEKIVIARAKKVSNIDLEVFSVFEKLIHAYRHATCYIWFHPKVGMWMGASPETLLEIEGSKFKTMSLAGTQRFVNTTEVAWGTKEIEEQQMVTDYVLSNLKTVTDTLKASDTYTAKAGALLHLRTDITGALENENAVAKLIEVLHPTPAVCGFPRETSKSYILKNENFDRSYYTGFLGELNIEGSSSLYVNLRCMEVLDENSLHLYVGGGITAKSNPVKEWEETVAKCKTMESIL
jgi:isochorismate synthase